ncbi:hypothetical protein ANO11243_001860 [Dothideomycetidae sp. 11243]|nr:hypothetical protein ANO11243_001860 [fungal sp. No.11243]
MIQETLGWLLYDRKTLFQASLVCRSWSWVASDLLWRHGTFLALSILAPSERQKFANRFRSLTHNIWDFSPADLCPYYGLDFPALKSVSFGPKKDHGLLVRKLLRPELLELHYRFGDSVNAPVDFFARFTTIRSLAVCVIGTSAINEMCDSLRRLITLEYLELRIFEDRDISFSELMDLRQLSRLETFALNPSKSSRLMSATPEEEKRFFDGFPNLLRCNLGMCRVVRTATLIAIGQACRRLTSLETDTSLELSITPQIPDTLFPELQFLMVGSVKAPSRPDTYEYMDAKQKMISSGIMRQSSGKIKSSAIVSTAMPDA